MPHAATRASTVVIAAGLVLMGISTQPVMAEEFSRDDETSEIVCPRVRVAVENGEETDLRDCQRNAIAVAVKYRLVPTDDRFDVVSPVAVNQENGSWRIESERIQSYEHQSPSMYSPSWYACSGATSHVDRRRQ